MKKLLLSAALMLSVLSAPAFAQTSTINPNIPANNSNLASSVLRANYLAAYNDINALWTALNAEIAAAITSLTGDVTATGGGAAAATVVKVHGVSYPATPATNTVPVVTGSNAVTYEAVPNAALANPSMTLAGHTVALGGSQTFAASDLTNGTTGSGAVALAVSPSFTTPNLGAATGTSVVWSGSAQASHFNASDATANIMPIGTTGQRPSASEGMIRDNSTLHQVEVYLNGGWQQVVSAVSGLVSLTTQVTGILPVANGGTNSSSLGCTISNNNGVLSTSQCSDDFVYSSSTYAIPASDAGRVVNYQGTGNVTMTIASASSLGFTQGFAFAINNPTAYTVTFSPTGSYCGNILNATSTCTIPPYTGCMYRSDNTNYPANLEACSAMTTIQIPGSTGNALYNSGGILAASSAITLGSSSILVTAPLNIGTAGFSDTGVGVQNTGNVNSYWQEILQNTNSGSSASADYVVGGNDMTASLHYADFGSNGSAGGTAPFTAADARYIYTTDNEFDIGALGTTAKINFATGANPTTQMTVGTSGVSIGTSSAVSTSVLTLGGQVSWPVGLGTTTPLLLGPTDQALTITATQPVDTNGNAIVLNGGSVTNNGSGGAWTGGAVTINGGAAGNGNSGSGANGGAINLNPGAGINSGSGGYLNFTGAVGGSCNYSPYGNGGGLNFVGGAGGTGGCGTNSGNGGAFSFATGAGGAETTAGVYTAGTSGTLSLSTGVGGAAAYATGGTGGASGTITIATGNGGSATGSSGTRNGGNSGNIVIKTGAAGTGASANGTVGTISFGVNNGTNMTIGSTGLIGIGTASPSGTLDVWPSGAGNSAFKVISPGGTPGNGLQITPSAAGSGVTLAAVSSSANEALTISALSGSALNLTGGQVNLEQAGNVVENINSTGSTIAFTPLTQAGATTHYTFAGAADTGLNAGANVPDVSFNLNQTRTHATGAVTLQEDFVINPTSHAFSGASTVTTAATFAVAGGPTQGTNASITNDAAIYVPTVSSYNSSVTNTYGLLINAASGATNNYAAALMGGSVGIGTAAPLATLHVNGTVKTAGYTVSGLPSGSIGMRAYVTDAVACTFLGSLTGGGSTFCPVIYNGSAWVAE